MQMMRNVVIVYERSIEIDYINFSGDSLIRKGGIWNCGGTAPLNLNSKLDKRTG
jgi:hypothetical protein